uniref:Uncharacterized protein n=1 Tax=Rhipicephalus microplus TaxID=6941 RepID=A0A6M2DB28_RHIMP
MSPNSGTISRALNILSILLMLIRFFWSCLLMLHTSPSIRKRPNPITLTSMCFSAGSMYILVSYIWTQMLTMSAKRSS